MPSVIATLEELFKFEEVVTESVNYGKAVEVVDFATVNNADSEPVTVIWPDMEHGPWIAGGACLRWYQGLPVGESDIDVFCSSRKQVDDIIANVKSYGRFSVKFESDNATTLLYWSPEGYSRQWTIQIIKRRYYQNLQEVIDSFDMTVCEIGTGGNEWLMNRHTAKDIRERNLRMKQPLQPDALKRLVKYWTYGYRPVEGLVEAVQNNPNGKWEFAIDEDYNNAF